MNIDHISISRESVWHLCQWQYRYKYHLKVISPKPEPIYFLYGKIVHKIIEQYTKAQGKENINEIARAVVGGDIKLEEHHDLGKPHILPAEYRNKKLPEHLRQFIRLCKHIGTEGEVEWHFKYDLDPPAGRHLVGVIDRFILKGNKIYIIDYKTTKKGPWRKTKANISSDLQLQSYARVAQKEFNIPATNINTALYYLEGGELIDATFSEETLSTVEQRLLKAYKDIELSDPEQVRGTTGDHCERCDYNKICPFWNMMENF